MTEELASGILILCATPIGNSTSPGSEMAGVPASVISATRFPSFICRTMRMTEELASGILILCATPIGNLKDMTPRVIEALQEFFLFLFIPRKKSFKAKSSRTQSGKRQRSNTRGRPRQGSTKRKNPEENMCLCWKERGLRKKGVKKRRNGRK